MSVILATDTYETIRGVIERLRRQTARQEIEVVVVARSAEAVKAALAFREEFGAMQIVECPSEDLAGARAAGIRSATAPIVYIGETHSYPHPRLAEALIAALAGPWAAAVPAIGNANPKGALSWAALLSDYGRWAEGLPAGEIPEAPPHNAAYRRAVLLALEDRLAPALSLGDELPLWMHAHAHRAYFEPAAQTDHVNVTRPGDWVRERFVAGFVVASHRCRRWSAWRRFVYVAGSFLIPAVCVWRILPGVRQAARHQRLPAATIPAIVAGMFVRAAGEMCGYAGSAVGNAERQMFEFEMHKLAHLARGKA
jgi:hypothetical protein